MRIFNKHGLLMMPLQQETFWHFDGGGTIFFRLGQSMVIITSARKTWSIVKEESYYLSFKGLVCPSRKRVKGTLELQLGQNILNKLTPKRKSPFGYKKLNTSLILLILNHMLHMHL